MSRIQSSLNHVGHTQRSDPLSMSNRNLHLSMVSLNGRDGAKSSLYPLPSPTTSILHMVQNKLFLWMLFVLAGITLFNLGIAMWIIKSLQIGTNGLGSGSIHFVRNGINVKTPVIFGDQLSSENIQVSSGKTPLRIQAGSESVKLLGSSESFMTLGTDAIEIQTAHFRVKDMEDPNRDPLFDVTGNQLTTTGVDSFVTPMGGFIVHSSFETSSISGFSQHDLSIESRQRGVQIEGDQRVILESRGGPQHMTAYESIAFHAREKVHFNSRKVTFPSMDLINEQPTVDTNEFPTPLNVCSCESGRLFLAESGSCQSSYSYCSPP